jgi:uncharacterized protein YndB with AHSA1/START domain
MATGTVTLHRILRAPAERIYRAFITPDAIVKFYPPHGFTAKVHQFDPKVGGSFKMSFTNFSTGNSHAFGGEFLEMISNERLVYSDRFDDSKLPGTMQTTVSLRTVLCGTELRVVQEGIPEMIPVEMCCLGWQETLKLLAQLVEADVKE